MMRAELDKIGLIAGSGKFPLMVADSARQRGMQVIAVAHTGETVPELAEKVDEISWIRPGQFGRLVRNLKSKGVKHVLMAGGITKSNVFDGARLDLKGIAVFGKVLMFHDDDILRAVARELEREGIAVVSPTMYLPELLAPPGCLTRRKPSKGEVEDIEFGWMVAKELGRLDIGHCVVVRRKTVLAVEAIEGTDRAIRRGGELAKERAVIVKVCKPNQDLRFDLPAVGPETIRAMSSVKAAVLAVEAQRTLILDKEEMIRLADANGIAIISRETQNSDTHRSKDSS